jgi:serine/threonine protein kinase/WD40 repeat protein
MGIPSDNGSASHEPALRLSVGDRLGRFEILGALGRGGMGDVFRARDPHLLREVAIKVLPTAFSRDPDRQRRFEREARVAASLNDPHIVAVHDVGVHEGIGFIVTELLEGETLRQRMNGRPLPPGKAVDYAIQIASGLAAGHDRGIVHRDIKPDNLFVTKDGRLKILDFGLAKVIDLGAEGDATATVTLDGVQIAPVVGTAAYMSPEQARGLRIDHRSDIFSTGAVLYEMLAGFAPFRRGTTAESLSAVLHDEPPALTRIVSIAPALERIVRHCLEKSPDERFQNGRDLIFDLEALPPAARTAEPLRARLRVSRARTLTLLALLLLTTLAYFAGRWTVPSAEPPSVHRVLPLTDFPGLEEFSAIAPDGRSVAFTASVGGRRQIFVRLLARGSPVPVTKDAVDHQSPRWTPDGMSLLYFSPAAPGDAQGAIWSIPALGGSPRRVITSLGDADVSGNGRVACFTLADGGVQLVTSSLDGTDARLVARSGPGYHRHPRWSPDGRWIAFQRGDGLRFDLFVTSPKTGEMRQLTHDRNIINGLAWLPDSSGIIYGSSRGSTIPYLPSMSLWEVRLDGGAPRQITTADTWYEQPDVHASGLVSVNRLRIQFDISTFPFGTDSADNVRRASRLTRLTGHVLTPSAAPDGREIAFLSDSGGHGNLWVKSTPTEDVRQITFEDDPNVTVGLPVWSPDGRSIAFVSSKGHTGFDFGIWLVKPDGTDARNVAKEGLGPAWSSDGQWLYYAETSAGILYKVSSLGGPAIMVRTEPTRNVIGVHDATLYYVVERPLLDGRPELEIRAATPEDGPSRALARIPASRVPSWQIVNPALSPDGEWLAMPLTVGYTTNIWALSTRTSVWRQVTDFGDRATFIARRVSWSPDGTSILAAVGEGDADIVLLDGLVKSR